MGSGSWSSEKFADYSVSRGRSYDRSTGTIIGSSRNQDMFTGRELDKSLNPYKVVRECVDTKEHPNTIPVILALDVTGSMGQSAVEVAKKLNVIMTELYNKVSDVEFMIIGIGDMKYDRTPLQASQFESDIRIAEQLDKLYFEFGGGGNQFESYSLAWYFGLYHTKLDCINRGKRGIIITMGDEMLNPYIPRDGNHTSINEVLGDTPQGDIDTKELYEEASKNFMIYHLNVKHDDHYFARRSDGIKESFSSVIGSQNYYEVTLDTIAKTIVDIVVDASEESGSVISTNSTGSSEGISW